MAYLDGPVSARRSMPSERAGRTTLVGIVQAVVVHTAKLTLTSCSSPHSLTILYRSPRSRTGNET